MTYNIAYWEDEKLQIYILPFATIQGAQADIKVQAKEYPRRRHFLILTHRDDLIVIDGFIYSKVQDILAQEPPHEITLVDTYSRKPII